MAKFKYCVDGSEPVIKDLKAVNDSYYDGEVLVAAAAEGGGVRSAAAGIVDAIIGVCNQDGSLPATSGYSAAGSTMGGGGPVTLTGTQAAGTIQNLKVIINPGAVYALEYDNSAQITWGTVTDTTVPFTCASGEGFANQGAGWAWSYNTGELDYVVSSATASTTCTFTTVTGTDTTSTSGIIIHPGSTGQTAILELDAGATKIDADQVDVGVAGTNGITAVILENRIESLAYGSEVLDPRVHNQQKRYMSSNTSYKDKAKIFAYARFKHALST